MSIKVNLFRVDEIFLFNFLHLLLQVGRLGISLLLSNGVNFAQQGGMGIQPKKKKTRKEGEKGFVVYDFVAKVSRK